MINVYTTFNAHVLQYLSFEVCQMSNLEVRQQPLKKQPATKLTATSHNQPTHHDPKIHQLIYNWLVINYDIKLDEETSNWDNLFACSTDPLLHIILSLCLYPISADITKLTININL